MKIFASVKSSMTSTRALTLSDHSLRNRRRCSSAARLLMSRLHATVAGTNSGSRLSRDRTQPWITRTSTNRKNTQKNSHYGDKLSVCGKKKLKRFNCDNSSACKLLCIVNCNLFYAAKKLFNQAFSDYRLYVHLQFSYEMVHCAWVKKITLNTITSGIGRAGCSEPRDLTHEVRVVVERVYERLQNRLTLYFF